MLIEHRRTLRIFSSNIHPTQTIVITRQNQLRLAKLKMMRTGGKTETATLPVISLWSTIGRLGRRVRDVHIPRDVSVDVSRDKSRAMRIDEILIS